MSEQDKPEKKKSPRGNSSLGAKFYIFIGFIISTVMNIGGLAKIIDSFIEWSGIILHLLDIYSLYIVDNIDLLISTALQYTGISFDIPAWVSIYLSTCISTSAMYLFAAKIAAIDTKTTNGIIGLMRGLSPTNFISIMFANNSSLASIIKKQASTKKEKTKKFFIIIYSIVILISFWFVFVFVAFTLLPVRIVTMTYASFKIYMNHDFEKAGETPEEDEFFKKKRFIYNTTVVFWYCIFGTLLATGVLVKANDVINDRCSSGIIDTQSWICKS